MMLCRLVDGTSEISYAYQRQCGVDATGMLKTYPVVCVMAKYAFNAHLRVYQQNVRGYHFVRRYAGSPRTSSAGGQMWIPTFFVV